MKRFRVAVLAWGVLCAPHAVLLAWGAEGASPPAMASLPEVLVRESGLRNAVKTATHHVTVITAREIARSTATSLADLLGTHGNLSVQSYFGNDRNATVDLRGMGPTAVSNVLILVDGVRINANDLSGADLSSVALSQIDQVEIVRGGGAVREGSGAVGGVIRITTRQAAEGGDDPSPAAADLAWRAGSFDSQSFDFLGAGRLGKVRVSAQANRLDSAGHRENSALRSDNASIDLRWATTLSSARVRTFVKASLHEDRYGLPGPVSQADFAAGAAARRASQHPLDGGRTEAQRLDIGATLDAGRWGELSMQASARERENPYQIGVDPSRTLADQENLITSSQWDWRMEYALGRAWLGDAHRVRLGWDQMGGDYARWENGLALPGATRLLGQAASRAAYVESSWQFWPGASVSGGVRWNRFSTAQAGQTFDEACDFIFTPLPVKTNCAPFAYRDTTPSSGRRWFNRAAELGLNWQIGPAWRVFANASRTFRAPNIDELLLASSSLRPQRGLNRELGVHHHAGDVWHWSATVFSIQNQDEIYYGLDADSGAQVNRNYEAVTRRQGLELAANWRLRPGLHWSSQLSYVQPQFVGLDADIPLVARATASTMLAWRPPGAFSYSLSGRYVGPRLDGNATENNPLAPLPSYSVWDTTVRYTHKRFQLALGVNNLFNAIYSTQAYSQTYYPMPERSAYLTLAWQL